MPRTAGIVVENNFSKGLITEATGLNFPENAVTETLNCVYEPKGISRRRLGIDYEDSFQVHAIADLYTTNGGAYSEFVWNTVNNDGSLSFLVQQVGDTVRFFEVGNGALTDNLETFEINLITYKTTATASDVYQNQCSFASGAGYLIITHPFVSPLFVEYSFSGNTITTTAITIEVRDFDGVDDSLDVDERPTPTLTDAHEYNLLNQGWGVTVRADTGVAVALDYWDAQRTDFPSNADVWWLFKDTAEELNSSWIDRFVRGTTQAPKGYFIYDAFDVDRNTMTGLTGLAERSSGEARPSVTAFFSGRAWYSGVKSTGYNSEIWFSKIIESPKDFGKCYQNNDPTNEDLFELLDSDGGVIKIPEADVIVALKPAGTALLVFATNGVWAIYGANDSGFKATEFTVSKITTIGAVGEKNIVLVDKSAIWWNYSGIYSIEPGDFQGTFKVNDISKTTIQEEYSTIISANIPFVKGAFNEIEKIVRWIVRSEAIVAYVDNFKYDLEYSLDVTSGAFSKFQFDNTLSPLVSGIFVIEGDEVEVEHELVTNNAGVNVTVSSGNSVFVEVSTVTNRGLSFRYLTTGPIGTSAAEGLTYSHLKDTAYVDWAAFDSAGISFESYFITGYRVRGQGILKQQNNYISIQCLQKDNSSVFIQGVWDYARSASTKRWSIAQQAYIERDDNDYTFRRLKIRGQGSSLQLKFYSEEGKPFFITGWSMIDSINQGP